MLDFFGELSLSKKVLAAVSEMGFEEPTPIQAKTIPLIMNKMDVIGQAQTGTGKTAAFGIPLVENINPSIYKVQALVLVPTRELAIQVAEEISRLGRYKKIKVLPIYGGQPIERQIRALKMGVHIVIGTPGRLLDHLERNTLRLQHVKFAVLDEADEMLDMGFIEDIESILRKTPSERQTMLFSATMPLPIKRLAERYLKNPQTVTISKENLTVPKIQQLYYEVPSSAKVDAITRILDFEDYDSVIVFCRTKRGVDELTASLQTRGYLAEGLHGDLTQAQRDKTMRRFRKEEVDILVATDVAARGLDIDTISHVINFDIPQDPESYVHRIGRTGRAGREGKAMTLIIPAEYRQLRLIEKLIKTRITRATLPTYEDILEQQKATIQQDLHDLLSSEDFSTYRSMVHELAEEFDPLDIACAALKYVFNQQTSEIIDTDFADELGNTGAKPGMVRLFFTIGRQQNIRPQDLVKVISEETGIAAKSIGDIRIYDKFTFVEVPEENALRVMNIMDRNNINGRRVYVQLARARGR
ncbi:MAG: DEAD/DEAH box helicase [Peptococcia bacterium]